jgi:hypothetical protein
LKDALRSQYYNAAQYPHPTTGAKTRPEQRIAHLWRIIELGCELDYIHKRLAEAHGELGDDEAARSCLRRAYQLNPDLSGAVRITRALGLPAKNISARATTGNRATATWTQPAEIPSPKQIRLWAVQGRWDSIVAYAKQGDYSRRLLPSARATLGAIAKYLGNCNHPSAEPALLGLFHFNYYWEITQAAVTALSKIGSRDTLEALQHYARNRKGGDESGVQNCISYLKARNGSSNALMNGDETTLLLSWRTRNKKQAKETMGLHGFFWNDALALTTSIPWKHACYGRGHALECTTPSGRLKSYAPFTQHSGTEAVGASSKRLTAGF